MIIKKVKNNLKLTNDGKLEIVFIGCGTAFGKKLFNNNFLLIKGDTHLMVDFGMTGPRALLQSTGLEVTEIENYFISHCHADHIGGLEYIALMNRYYAQKVLNKPKLNMIIPKEFEKILWNYSLRGGLEWNEADPVGKHLKFKDYFNPIRPKQVFDDRRAVMKINFKGINIEIFETNHIPERARSHNEAFHSFGLFVDNKILITCDTKFDRELLDYYGPNVDYIFHDSALEPNPVHSSLKELTKLPKKLKEKIFLMHYDDNFENYDAEGFAGFVKQGYRYIF
jgi:ribonuclease BN (tRNA processing enzyme)